MARKVVQLVHVPGDEDVKNSLFALCDDGTMWQHTFDAWPDEPDWTQFVPVPQEEVDG
jgi:hypothetical protein